jgi:hypothetical protein
MVEERDVGVVRDWWDDRRTQKDAQRDGQREEDGEGEGETEVIDLISDDDEDDGDGQFLVCSFTLSIVPPLSSPCLPVLPTKRHHRTG